MSREELTKKVHMFYDEPIEEISRDRFAYNTYVEALLKLIKNSMDNKRSFNIGLFGKWGVGKTSIINLLREQISKDKEIKDEVKMVVFNVWKYTKDSLRRQFLRFLDSDEGLNAKIGIEDLLEKSEQRSETKFSTRFTYILFLIGVFTMGMVIFLLSNRVFKVNTIPSAIISIIITILGTLSKTFERSTTKTTQFHRIDQPEQFEKEFKKIIQKARERWKKIIIVFDDLDRCSKDTIQETLTMIKTYLNENDCIYIIPCDDAGIKNHLIKTLGYKDYEANEFLKKFFQVSFRIPPFVEEDIFSFTCGLVDKAAFPKEIEKVLVAAFWETPRRVKLFLNNLSFLRLVAFDKEKSKKIKKRLITNNLQFLTKIEVIRERWPDLFKEIAIDESFLRIIEETAMGKKPTVSEEKKKKAEGILKSSEVKNFLNATVDVTTDAISAFIRLSQPKYLAKLPDASEFELKVLTGDVEFVKAKLLDPDNGNTYITAIKKIIERKIRTGYQDQAFNALKILVQEFPVLPDNRKVEIVDDVVTALNISEIRAKLKLFLIGNLFEVVKMAQTSQKKELLLNLSDLVDKEIEIVKYFVLNYDELVKDFREVYSNLRDKITRVYPISDVGNKILHLIVENDKSKDKIATKDIVSQDILHTLIAKITTGTTPEDKENADIYLSLQYIASDNTKLEFIKKNLSIIKSNPSNALDQPKAFAVSNLRSNSFPSSLGKSQNDFYQTLINSMNSLTTPLEKLKVIEIILINFSLILDNQKEDFVNNYLINYINSLDAIFNKDFAQLVASQNTTKFPILEKVWSALANRSIPLLNQDLDTIICRRCLSKDKPLKNYLSQILSSNMPLAINVIKSLSAEIKRQDANIIIETLVEFSRRITYGQLPIVFGSVLEIFDKAATDYRGKFGDRLFELIKDYNNLDNQNQGATYLGKVKQKLSRSKRSYMVQQIVQNLPRPFNPNLFAGITNMMRAILELQSDLPKDGSINFVDYILPLVITDTSPDTIRIETAKMFSEIKEIPAERTDQVLEGLFSSLKTSSSKPRVYEALKNLLLLLKEKKTGKRRFWGDVRKYLSEREISASKRNE